MAIGISNFISFSEKGKRPYQEDVFYPHPQDISVIDNMFIICDGMGGHANGGIASNVVTNALVQNYNVFINEGQSVKAFEHLLELTWEELDNHYDEVLGERQMGTTLAFLSFTEKGYLAAHIGDSRIYHIRPGIITELVYQSSDHSQVSELIKTGTVTQMEALKYSHKNILNRAMVPHTRYEAEIYEGTDIQSGDIFVLCSDGVTEYLTDEMIRFIFAPYRTIVESSELIRQHCLYMSNDNYTCIIVPIQGEYISTTGTDDSPRSSGLRGWKDDELLRETIQKHKEY